MKNPGTLLYPFGAFFPAPKTVNVLCKNADVMGTCSLSAHIYIENICDKIEKAMDVKLRNYQMPMDPDYHPEIDNSIVLSDDLIAKYRMLVGSALWAATLGRGSESIM